MVTWRRIAWIGDWGIRSPRKFNRWAVAATAFAGLFMIPEQVGLGTYSPPPTGECRNNFVLDEVIECTCLDDDCVPVGPVQSYWNDCKMVPSSSFCPEELDVCCPAPSAECVTRDHLRVGTMTCDGGCPDDCEVAPESIDWNPWLELDFAGCDCTDLGECNFDDPAVCAG